MDKDKFQRHQEQALVERGVQAESSTTKIWHKELSNIGKCTIGNNCTIHSHVWIGDDVLIGDGCRIQAFAFIPTGVEIGDNVFIGPHVCFTNDKNPPSARAHWQYTIVMKGVSIGANATILPGIFIGEGARVGAGAVVTKDVMPYTTVVGNPARVIKGPNVT